MLGSFCDSRRMHRIRLAEKPSAPAVAQMQIAAFREEDPAPSLSVLAVPELIGHKAVRRDQVLLLNAELPYHFYGSEALVGAAVAALEEGKQLKETYAARLKASLEKADLPRLLRESPWKLVKPAEIK